MAYLLLQSGPQALRPSPSQGRPRDEIESLLEEEELDNALDNDDSSLGEEVEANKGQERPQNEP